MFFLLIFQPHPLPTDFHITSSACAAIKKQEAAGAKEHRGLRDRLEGYASRGPPGAELWLFELLYLHNASAANSMPEAWHEVREVRTVGNGIGKWKRIRKTKADSGKGL